MKKNPNIVVDSIDMDNERMIKAVGDLIYLTDPFIYPDMFDNDIINAEKAAYNLLSEKTVFYHKNIKVALVNNEVAGFMILLDYYPDDNSKLIKQCLVKALGKLPKKIDDVLKDYFDDFKQGWAGTHIMSLCVLPQYRRLRVATRLLQSLDNNKDYSLACIKDNYPARVLYEKCGFEFEKEYLGYTAVKCVELIKRGKHE